jgi:hypothetical protein
MSRVHDSVESRSSTQSRGVSTEPEHPTRTRHETKIVLTRTKIMGWSLPHRFCLVGTLECDFTRERRSVVHPRTQNPPWEYHLHR